MHFKKLNIPLISFKDSSKTSAFALHHVVGQDDICWDGKIIERQINVQTASLKNTESSKVEKTSE